MLSNRRHFRCFCGIFVWVDAYKSNQTFFRQFMNILIISQFEKNIKLCMEKSVIFEMHLLLLSDWVKLVFVGIFNTLNWSKFKWKSFQPTLSSFPSGNFFTHLSTSISFLILPNAHSNSACLLQFANENHYKDVHKFRNGLYFFIHCLFGRVGWF